MTHSILNIKNQTEITILDSGSFVSISIHDSETNETAEHVLNKSELHDFIGILLHIQAKKRK